MSSPAAQVKSKENQLCEDFYCIYCDKNPITPKKCSLCKGHGMRVESLIDNVPHLGKCYMCHGKGRVWY